MTTTKLTLGKSNGYASDLIYGQFIEHLGTCINGGVCDPASKFADANGIRTDVRELARKLAPPVLRFPGGTVMCIYHWEDAIGPQETRVRRKNLIWGGELDPSFGTAEFVTYCRSIGAEPMICVNMASGTPEEAGNWVEYCNGTGNTYYANLRRKHGYPEPFHVKYWCIGNECYAEPDIGIQHDVQIYIRDAREFIKFMKLTDKSIKTVIVGCDNPVWNKAVLDALHPMTDYFSLHHYSGEREKGLYGPFEGEQELIAMIREVSELLQQYPDKVTDFSQWYRFPPRESAIEITVDEWNIWNADSSETYGLYAHYNWRDAIWVASALNVLLSEPRIGMANMAQMVNIIAPIIAEEHGSWFQTIAYPFLMYREHMHGERVEVSFEPVWIDGAPANQLNALSVCALRGEDGVLRVAAVNRDFSQAHEICICDKNLTKNMVGEQRQEPTACMTTLSAPSWSSVCTLDSNCVQQSVTNVNLDQIRLLPGSVNLIEIQK